MATLGLDDSAYRQGVDEAKAQTRTAVSSMTKEYNRLYSEVLHLTAAYQRSSRETGENSQATQDFKQKLADAQKQLQATAQGLRTAEQYMESYKEKTESTTESLVAAFTKAQMLTSAIQSAWQKIRDLGTSFVQSGMEYNSQIEIYRTALTNMLGDAERANDLLNEIKADAARTPFSTDSLVSATQYLLSAGENAEYSRKTILALGDAVKATGGGDDELNRMAQNLQQIANVGKASAVDIKQFAFAGINIYQVLADYTGKSVQDVQNMTITYDVLTQALQAAAEEGGRYYNSMGTQSQTLNGRMTTLQDNAKQLAGQLTTGLSSAYGSVVSAANEWVSSILNNDEKLEQLKNTLTAVVSVVAGAAAAFVTYKAAVSIASTIEAVQKATQGLSLAQAALNAVMAANPIAIVVTLLAGLTAALATAYATSETFRDTVNGVFSSVKSIAGSAIDWVTNKIRSLISGVAGAIAALNALKNGEGWEEAKAAYTNAYQDKMNDYSLADGRRERGKRHNERVRQAQEEAKSTNKNPLNDLDSSIVFGDGDSDKKKGTTTVAKKIAQVIDSLTEKSRQVANGITTDIQTITEKYDDDTEHITKTVTESGTEIVDGVARNYKTITKYVDGVQQKVEKTVEDIDTSVSAVQIKIDKQLSEAQSQWKSGIMGTLQSTISDLKNGNWSGLATDFAKLVWGEVTQEQRDIISKWLTDALTAINNSYSGGGLSAAKDTIKALFGDGIAEGATEAGTAVKSFSQILDGLNASGGVDTKLAGIAGSFTNAAGTITKALSGIVGFIVSNPVVAVALGLTALVGGAALSAWSKNKDEKLTNNYESPFSKTPVYDSLAEFSYRADQFNRYKGLTASPFSSGQQDTTGRQQLSVLQRISNSLDEHLPAIGTGTLVIDANGVQALAGAMQPTLVDGIDGDLGIRSTRKARGG